MEAMGFARGSTHPARYAQMATKFHNAEKCRDVPETCPFKISCAGEMRQRRGCLAADNRRGFLDEFVVLESLHHE